MNPQKIDEKNKRKTRSRKLAERYEPPPLERAAVEAHFARKKVTPPAPRIMNVAEKDGVMSATLDHPNPSIGHVVLMEALGTVDPDFLHGLLGQLAIVAMRGRTVDEQVLNIMLSMVKGVKPTDQVESMLAAQMAAVHMAPRRLAVAIRRNAAGAVEQGEVGLLFRQNGQEITERRPDGARFRADAGGQRMGPRLTLPHFVHGFVDRHGKPRFYFRRRGLKQVPLPGLYGVQ